MRRAFEAFLTAQSSVELFFLIMLAAIVIGLEVAVLRWVLFECWLCGHERLHPADFAELGNEAKLAAFRAAVDEHYRYHQFWGGVSVVMPIAYCGWLRASWHSLTATSIVLSVLAFGHLKR